MDGGGNGDGRSTHGPDGRAPGNRFGRGNPLAGRAARIRAILLKELTPKRARMIALRLIKMAMDGNLAAVRELLDRTAGKPSESQLLERLEALEQRLEERSYE